MIKLIDVILSDFAKVFDAVSHEALLIKLEASGLVFICYHGLHISYQTKAICNFLWRPVKSNQIISRVIQGSVLRNLIFIIYLNDLPDCIKSATVSII